MPNVTASPKPKKKRVVKKRKAAKKPKKKEEFVPFIEDIHVDIVPTPPVKDTTVTLKRCGFYLCKRLVDDFGYPPFCSITCATWHHKSIANRTLYKPEFANEKLWEYLKHCEHSHRLRYVLVKGSLVPMRKMELPDIAGFALWLGRPVATVVSWGIKYPEFKDALQTLKAVQKQYLLNNGLSGLYQGRTVNLILQTNHGFKEKSEKVVKHQIGVVREVYEKADQLGALEAPAFDDEGE